MDRDLASEIDALQKTVLRMRFALVVSGLLVTGLILSGWSQRSGVVRASALEITDSKGRLRASITGEGTDTIFKLIGGGPPNGKGIRPSTEWWLGVNTNSIRMTDDTGDLILSPHRVLMTDSTGSRITLERPSPFFSPPSSKGARLIVKNGNRIATFPPGEPDPNR